MLEPQSGSKKRKILQKSWIELLIEDDLLKEALENFNIVPKHPLSFIFQGLEHLRLPHRIRNILLYRFYSHRLIWGKTASEAMENAGSGMREQRHPLIWIPNHSNQKIIHNALECAAEDAQCTVQSPDIIIDGSAMVEIEKIYALQKSIRPQNKQILYLYTEDLAFINCIRQHSSSLKNIGLMIRAIDYYPVEFPLIVCDPALDQHSNDLLQKIAHFPHQHPLTFLCIHPHSTKTLSITKNIRMGRVHGFPDPWPQKATSWKTHPGWTLGFAGTLQDHKIFFNKIGAMDWKTSCT